MPTIRTATLEIGFEAHGPQDGPVTVLLHGFPDDIRAWDAVAPALAGAGHRVIIPYLRGYGPTRFLSAATPRSGEQGALGQDLKDLLDALGIERATLAGYDWGGRAACVVAALWPERVVNLVSATGYNIHHIAVSHLPASPEAEHRLWYQWYLHTERGRAGLAANRHDFCRLLWRMWSPDWAFTDAAYARTAASFDNPDFVDVVIHSYRHRYALAPTHYPEVERRLAAQPTITVPSTNLYGQNDGVRPAPAEDDAARHFAGPYRRVVIPNAGHFLPQEAPEAYVAAILNPPV